APGASSTSGTGLGTPSASSQGEYIWTYAVPSSAASGTYFVQVVAQNGNSVGWGLSSFTVMTVSSTSPDAAALQSIQNSLSSLTTTVNGIQSGIGSLSFS